MMRQVPNTDQLSGSSDQKKSVFDRLGRQLEGGRSMKRRPSPGQFGEFLPPNMHEGDFGRYGRDPHAQQAEMDWRYQNDRRQMPLYVRDRHPLPPPTPPHLQPMLNSHYELDMGARQHPYFPHPSHPYHGPQLVPPPPLGPGEMPMSMHQQRSSPKYDRHGNVILRFKERGGMPPNMRMDHHQRMSPSRNFLPPNAMMHPAMHEASIRSGNMYPHPRWHESMEQEVPIMDERLMQDGRFSPASSHRFQQQQMRQQQILNQQGPPSNHTGMPMEAPRYAKWKERRDVITNLDRETAQSSSRTDSLKITLLQPENRASQVSKSEARSEEAAKKASATNSSNVVQKKTSDEPKKEVSTTDGSPKVNSSSKEPGSSKKESKDQTVAAIKTDPQDISDGEIVDDEDSSDESDSPRTTQKDFNQDIHLNQARNHPPPQYARNRESHQYYESSSKKRRMLEREDYSMDYETISDEDLDVFMGDKKIGNDSGERFADEDNKSLSELELLNALGLDWANLVEMAKQSKTSSKESTSHSSALPRFSMPNYLPTLGISADLAGPELYELITKVCRS